MKNTVPCRRDISKNIIRRSKVKQCEADRKRTRPDLGGLYAILKILYLIILCDRESLKGFRQEHDLHIK